MVLVDSIVSPSLYWGVRTHTDHRVGALLAILGTMKEFEVGPPTAPNIYCQDPALTVLSILFLVQSFFVCFVSQHMLCLCLCLPCVPLVPPPCFPWSRPLLFSPCPHLLDGVHLSLVCSAALYGVPFPCVFAGLFWCSWS